MWTLKFLELLNYTLILLQIFVIATISLIILRAVSLYSYKKSLVVAITALKSAVRLNFPYQLLKKVNCPVSLHGCRHPEGNL